MFVDRLGTFQGYAGPSLSARFGERGFSVSRVNQYRFCAESATCEICVGLSAYSVGVSLQPAAGSHAHGGYVPLSDVLASLAPQLGQDERHPKRVSSDSTIRKEIDRQLDLVLEHCGDFVRGDHEAWTVVYEYHTSRGGLTKEQSETVEAWLLRLRSAAASAWQARDYNQVMMAYDFLTSRGGKLTIAERLKMSYSSRRIPPDRP